MHATAAERYLSERVSTATPAELTAMLFDGAVADLRRAGQAQAESDWLGAAHHLIHAQEIVLELRCALNPDGGEIAASLASLYAWVHKRLVDANVRHDAAATAECLRILSELRDAWRQACLHRAA